METDTVAPTGEEDRPPVLDWEGSPQISFKGKRDYHYKHERLIEGPGSSPCRTASPNQVVLRRIVQVAPNQGSPRRTLHPRSSSREHRPPKDIQETIVVHASDFKKYGNDVNLLRNCKIEDAELVPDEPVTQKIASEGEEDYTRNPWAGKTRLLCDLLQCEGYDESGVNQKWFPPPTATGRYETPSPGPKRRYYGSETSTRTSSPATASADATFTPRKESRPRSRAPSPGRNLQGQPWQKYNSSQVYVASPPLPPPRSPIDSRARRRAPHSSIIEARAYSRGRQPAVLVAGALETQTTRLPPRLPQRASTPKQRVVAC